MGLGKSDGGGGISARLYEQVRSGQGGVSGSDLWEGNSRVRAQRTVRWPRVWSVRRVPSLLSGVATLGRKERMRKCRGHETSPAQATQPPQQRGLPIQLLTPWEGLTLGQQSRPLLSLLSGASDSVLTAVGLSLSHLHSESRMPQWL